MKATWHIEHDQALGLIRMTLGGFFLIEDVNRFDRDRQQAITAMKLGVRGHLALCDVSQTHLSTPEVATALQVAINAPIWRARRCAIVIRGTLNRLQAKRVVQRPDIGMFESRAAAEAWLLSGQWQRRRSAA